MKEHRESLRYGARTIVLIPVKSFGEIKVLREFKPHAVYGTRIDNERSDILLRRDAAQIRGKA